MVMNFVIHRLNIDHIDRDHRHGLELGADYVELANTQYYSWAYLNRVGCCRRASNCSAPSASPTNTASA